MRIVLVSFLIAVLCSSAPAQTRDEAVGKFYELKNQASALEQTILSPDKKDIEAAARENVGVFRLLPREVYDKGFFRVNGGGAYYSFYFRIPDWGHGTDIGFERDYLQTGFQRCGLMTDLGTISLSEVSRQTPQAVSLASYQNAKSLSACSGDYYSAYRDGLKLDEAIFKVKLPPINGHTYLIRSISYGYYDILAAFQVYRKDADGSLIIFWKQIEQFDTPQQDNFRKVQASDDEILKNIKGWAGSAAFPNLQAEVGNGVVTFRGKISKERLAHAVQLANGAGAVKVINLLTIE